MRGWAERCNEHHIKQQQQSSWSHRQHNIQQTRPGHKVLVFLQDFWGKVQWWWERPPLKRMRTTVSMAQWSVKLPALLALVATQVGLLASQV